MLKYQIQSGVAEILLNNPPVNGITSDMLDALMMRLRQAGADTEVRAIVIGSAVPGRFSGGLDLRTFRESSAKEAYEVVNKLYVQLYDVASGLPKPVIGAISGAVRGGGMSIAITCDILIAADNSTFGYPELEIGLLPSIHFHHLPRIVGKQRAFDLLFSGRMRLGKAAFIRATDFGYRQNATHAVDLVSSVFETIDCAEGLLAFTEKRSPKWSEPA